MRLVQLRDIALAGLLGAALLLGFPGSTQAEPAGKRDGKGRVRAEKRVERKVEPKVERRRGKGKGKVSRRVERRVEERRTVRRSPPRRAERVVEREYSYRAPAATRVQTSYRAPRWSGGRYYTGARYHSVYRGYPVYREYVSYRYAPAYAPAYGWRYYCAPRYDYHTHVVYVQPVRFFLAADFVIGGVGVSARYVDPGPVYGCNFCDARFATYHAYEVHVEHDCGHIPHGYRVYADDWHDEVWEHGHDDEEWDD